MQIITFLRGAADKGMRLPHPVLTDKRLTQLNFSFWLLNAVSLHDFLG